MTRKWVKDAIKDNKLATLTGRTIHFINTNKKLVTNISLIILAILILVPIGSVWRNKREQKAMGKLAEAHLLYDKKDINGAKKAYEEVIKDFSFSVNVCILYKFSYKFTLQFFCIIFWPFSIFLSLTNF